MTYWQRWIWQPQTAWLRKATFQLHLWSGIGIGLYVLLVSVTGSILVYRNELYRAATPDPIIVAESGPRLTDEQLKGAATRAYPGYTVIDVSRSRIPIKPSVFPSSAAPTSKIASSIRTPEQIWAIRCRSASGWFPSSSSCTTTCSPGKRAAGSTASARSCWSSSHCTGIVVWWPGIKTWRRSLTVHRNVGWRRFTWDLHSMIGFWTLGFILLFAVKRGLSRQPPAVSGPRRPTPASH